MHIKYQIIIGFLGLLCLGCHSESSVTRLKLGHGLNTKHPVHKGIEYLAERVKEKSNGKLQIDIYPSGQLGAERQLVELLQIGSLAMTKVSAAVMENFAPDMKVLSLPYLFRDRAHAYKVQDGEIGQSLLNQSQEYRLKGLTFFDAGQRSFYTKDRLIEAPSDLEGLKIRVMESATAMNLVRSLGGSPTPISWGELYTALQQGIVDGAENNPPSFYTSRHYEICKYYSLNEHSAVPDILIMGTEAWNNLNKQEQRWLSESVTEATDYQRKLWQKSEEEALEAVKAEGVKVIRPDKTEFFEKTKGILESHKDDKKVYDLITRIQSIQ